MKFRVSFPDIGNCEIQPRYSVDMRFGLCYNADAFFLRRNAVSGMADTQTAAVPKLLQITARSVGEAASSYGLTEMKHNPP